MTLHTVGISGPAAVYRLSGEPSCSAVSRTGYHHPYLPPIPSKGFDLSRPPGYVARKTSRLCLPHEWPDKSTLKTSRLDSHGALRSTRGYARRRSGEAVSGGTSVGGSVGSLHVSPGQESAAPKRRVGFVSKRFGSPASFQKPQLGSCLLRSSG